MDGVGRGGPNNGTDSSENTLSLKIKKNLNYEVFYTIYCSTFVVDMLTISKPVYITSEVVSLFPSNRGARVAQ